MRVPVFAILIFLSVGVCAGQADEQLDRLRSNEFSQKANALWLKGDRLGAMISALRGLPHLAEPGEDDRYRSAWDALRLAVVSRSVSLPIEKPSASGFSRQGDRVATVAVYPQGPVTEADGLRLWNPQNGALIANLMPPAALFSEGHGVSSPVFSPNGNVVVQGSSITGQVHVFDAATGAAIAILGRGDALYRGIGVLYAFSGDSTRLITLSHAPQIMSLWNTGDWSLVTSRALTRCEYGYGFSGGRSDVIYLGLSVEPSLCDERLPSRVVSIGADGVEKVVFSAVPPFDFGSVAGGLIDPTERFVKLTTMDAGLAIIDLRSGTIVSDVPGHVMAAYGMLFSVSGDYLINFSQYWAEYQVEGFDFYGNPHPASLQDVLPFAHHVTSENGVPLGGIQVEAGVRGYDGHNVAEGRALYDFVWGRLPEAIKQQVNQDRVGQ